MFLNPIDLPFYWMIPLAFLYVLLWYFIGSLWLGVFNNYIVRKDTWGRCQESGVFLFMTLWPLTMIFILFCEIVMWTDRFTRVFIRPFGPVFVHYCDWVIAAYKG